MLDENICRWAEAAFQTALEKYNPAIFITSFHWFSVLLKIPSGANQNGKVIMFIYIILSDL